MQEGLFSCRWLPKVGPVYASMTSLSNLVHIRTGQAMTQNPANSSNRRKPLLLALCGCVTAVVMLLHAKPSWPLSDKLADAENYVRDSFARAGRKTAIDPRLVLIGVDRQSYEGEILASEANNDPVLAALRERFPWSRRVWAALIE